jgi:hypothetical protein
VKPKDITDVVLLLLGVFFMVMAVVASGMRGAHSIRGPLVPIRPIGRVILFLAGLSVFLAGLGLIPH